MTAFIIFITGLIFGSFLSVLFSRLEVGDRPQKKPTRKKKQSTLKDVLVGRSRCDHCHTQLPWYDNIPILSFLLLRGKCRKCGTQISHYHPVLEVSSGLLFVAAYLFYGLDSQFFIACFFGLVMLLLFAFDSKHQIIPNLIVVPALLAALVLITAQFFVYQDHPTLQLTLVEANPFKNLLGGAAAGGFFLLLYAISGGRWLGGGDLKLGVLIGLLLGWPHVLVALILAYLIGTAYAIALLVGRHATLQSMLPFGPMLVMGWLVTLFYGEYIIQWYQGWFLL